MGEGDEGAAVGIEHLEDVDLAMVTTTFAEPYRWTSLEAVEEAEGAQRPAHTATVIATVRAVCRRRAGIGLPPQAWLAFPGATVLAEQAAKQPAEATAYAAARAAAAAIATLAAGHRSTRGAVVVEEGLQPGGGTQPAAHRLAWCLVPKISHQLKQLRVPVSFARRQRAELADQISKYGRGHHVGIFLLAALGTVTHKRVAAVCRARRLLLIRLVDWCRQCGRDGEVDTRRGEHTCRELIW